MDKLSFSGDSNIGLMGFATDSFVIIGKDLKADDKKIKEILNAEVYRAKIAGTNLAGLFLNGTSKKIYAPRIIFEHELDRLKENFNVEILETNHTALGNNFIFGKKIIANPEVEKNIINKLKAIPMTIGDNEVVGSSAALNSKNMIITPDVSDEEIRILEKHLKVEIGVGSVNFGNKMVGSGIILNNKGLLVGSSTSGPELMRLKEIFDL